MAFFVHFLVFVVLTIVTCLLGDYIVFTAFQNQVTIVKALADSTIHGLVAYFSWLIVQNQAFIQALICALIAMSIDLDHFIQGKLEVIVTLTRARWVFCKIETNKNVFIS